MDVPFLGRPLLANGKSGHNRFRWDWMQRLPADFDFEREMTIPATRWLTNQRLLVKQEFRTPWGICDIVGLELAHPRVTDRLLLRQRKAIGPPHRIALLQLVPLPEIGRAVTAEELSSRIGKSVEWVANELRALAQCRFVRKLADGSFQNLSGWAPLHRRIVAVELKLGRVEEAIAQARAHLAFATESFVGLPTPIAERLLQRGRRSHLQESGVGLLSINAVGATMLVPAVADRNEYSDATLQMHCVERFWRDFTNRLA